MLTLNNFSKNYWEITKKNYLLKKQINFLTSKKIKN